MFDPALQELVIGMQGDAVCAHVEADVVLVVGRRGEDSRAQQFENGTSSRREWMDANRVYLALGSHKRAGA